GKQTNDFTGDTVHFTPGSSGLNYLDPRMQTMRRPLTTDYIEYVKVVDQLPHIASQSTAMIPADVVENVSDSYRLFLSLLYSSKPVVTGTFTIESFDVMKEMLLAVRGSARELKEMPLAVFSCCPTSPLKWSDVTSQNVLDCAKHSIPVEFISMPLSGFVAPVTLVGTLVQHTAETFSGIVLSQLANPGTPILYGGSPAIFDYRYESTPMGAAETMMIDCAYNEIGKYLGMPTQAYISLTDSKQLDVQAGLESGMGATLAALSGINSISGPGMLDFESCISLEKLVIDNEICGMALRLVRGIEPKEDFPALPRFEELLTSGHLLISKHTRKYLKEEIYFPGPVINRANNARWTEEGSSTMDGRTRREVERLLHSYQPAPLPGDAKKELVGIMERYAGRHGQDTLPGRTP
ncbi:MAG TPA: trimethylamine methyltransferase family protein, partial [Bacteroidota bacterium]|nr:trimethylamine methyltransferase family protein [Bacteroidota bacterium]